MLWWDLFCMTGTKQIKDADGELYEYEGELDEHGNAVGFGTAIIDEYD